MAVRDMIIPKMDSLIDEVLLRVDPDFQGRDAVYIEKSRMDIRHTINFTLESLAVRQKSILVNYYHWLIETLSHYQITEKPLLGMFSALNDALAPDLDPEEAEFLHDIKLNDLRIGQKMAARTLGPEAKAYLSFLLDKDRGEATRFLLGLVRNSLPMETVFVDVIQAAMVEVGRLWQTREIGVADEHMATVITQYAMTQFYPLLFDSKKNGKRFVALALGDELHEIGIRMVADLLEYRGYQTQYLGASMPSDSVMSHLRKYRPHLLGLSVTLGSHLSRLSELIRTIRNDPSFSSLKILIGGQAVAAIPEAVSVFGADGFAFDAAGALREGDRLVGNQRA